MAGPAKQIEGWIRHLTNDRREIFLKGAGRKIRASGSKDEMYELVDWFEERTGLTVNVPDRVYTGPRPIAGQLVITMELESEENNADGELPKLWGDDSAREGEVDG